jgi:hypothetical protein
MRHIIIPVTEDLRKLIQHLNDIFHSFDEEEDDMTKTEHLRGLISDIELAAKGMRDLLRQLEEEEMPSASMPLSEEVIRIEPEPAAVTDPIDVEPAPMGIVEPPPIVEVGSEPSPVVEAQP